MSMPVFIIAGAESTAVFSFQLISADRQLLLFFNHCPSRNDCIEKISVAAIHAQYDNRFEKHNSLHGYSYVLKSGTGSIVGRSPRFSTEFLRDKAIKIVQQEIFFALIKEEQLEDSFFITE
jgi:hypothetical protein